MTMTRTCFYLGLLLIPTLSLSAGEVSGLTLIDAAKDEEMGPLTEGAVIDLGKTISGINVLANVEGEVGSIRFALNDNGNYRTESQPPYTLHGESRGNYANWAPTPGNYTLTATPYSEAGAGGTAGIPFAVTFEIKLNPAGQYPDVASQEDFPALAAPTAGVAEISGELKRWHALTLTFTAHDSSETGHPNPFLHYRADVRFSKGDSELVAPGYYAGDGKGGAKGNKWRVHFSPPETGEWTYRASFRAGFNVNVSTDASAGEPTAFHGAAGSFDVSESDKTAADFRASENGLLINRGHHYLTFGGSGRPWIKGGPDIPENLFGYEGFENTPQAGHSFAAHVSDWQPGDPDWDNGKGKAIIGAFNYIAAKGGNSVYFLPMNIGGDGKDTFPTIAPFEKTRYDNSKLQQWETVMRHAQSLGIFLHFQLAEMEEENENYHDVGMLGPQRKLFYRELMARFGHHNGIQFNLGEENNYGTERRVEFAQYIKSIDPYNHPVASHTWGGKEESTYDPLIEKLRNGEEVGIDMTSFQGGKDRKAMAELMERFRKLSSDVKHPWVMSYDEPQPIHNDKSDLEQGYDMGRRFKMWPAYMGGGGGFEWYVQNDGGGHGFDHAINDFSEMDVALEWSAHAREFLYQLPLLEAEPDHELAKSVEGEMYVLAKKGQVYGLYNDESGKGFRLDLSEASGTFDVRWFDPRNGGSLQKSEINTVEGGGIRNLGDAPTDADGDWACLVRKRGAEW